MANKKQPVTYEYSGLEKGPEVQAKSARKKQYDYSGLEPGSKVQAESGGLYYTANIIQVSTSRKRSKNPVKITFKGYDPVYDEWVDGSRLRSKALIQKQEPPNQREEGPREFKIGYWKIRGLAAVLRMIFEYKQAKYTDHQYEKGAEWHGSDKPKLAEKNPLANLPYLECGDDLICQTNAILSYVGQKLRLNGYGKTRQMNEQLLCEIYDVRNQMINLVYPFKKVCRTEEEHKEQVFKLIETGPFTKFEAWLVLFGTDFFCGEKLCTSDFHIWEMLDQFRLLAEKHGKDIFEKIPKCKAFHERIKALPSLQNYFSSDAYKFPCNAMQAGAYFG